MFSSILPIIEVTAVTALTIIIIYVVSFTYRLKWYYIVWTIVATSLITATLVQTIVAKHANRLHKRYTLLDSQTTASYLSSISSIIVFIMLIYRFDLKWALGLAILIGFETYFWRKTILYFN